MAKRRQAIKAILSENNISRGEFRRKGPEIGNLKKSMNELDEYGDNIVTTQKKLLDSYGADLPIEEVSKMNKEASDLLAKGREIKKNAEENNKKVEKYMGSSGSQKRKARRSYIAKYEKKLDSEKKPEVVEDEKPKRIKRADKVASTTDTTVNTEWNDPWDKNAMSEKERANIAWQKQGIKQGKAYGSQRVFPSGETAIYNYETGRYEKKLSENESKYKTNAYLPEFARTAPSKAEQEQPQTENKVAEVINKPKEEPAKAPEVINSPQPETNKVAEVVSNPKKDIPANTTIQNNVSGDGSKISEVVTTPVNNNAFDQDAYNKRVLDKKQQELEANTVTIDATPKGDVVTTTGEAKYVAPSNSNNILSNTVQTEPNKVNAETPSAPGAAINNVIQSNNVADKTSNAVLEAGINDANTAGEVFEVPKIADEVKTEAEREQANLDMNTAKVVNETIDNPPIAPVTAGVMGTINANQGRPTYDTLTNKDQIGKEIVNDYKDLTGNIPSTVIEKLGVQDYYPEVGRDIAVGTFTGSRIGSQTIYSGAGGLLPKGLYDERKRALVKAAKEKQAALDKFMEIPDTSEQFNTDYKQQAFSFIQDGMAKHNWDLNAAMKDKEFMKGYYRFQTLSKEITYTDAIVDKILESQISKDGKPVAYVPTAVLEEAYKFREGKLDNMEDIFSGKSKIMDYAKNMRNYANGTVWADDMVKTWLDPNKRVELPMNLKTGKEIDEKALGEIQDSIKKLKENTGSYDSFLSVVKKYYDLDSSLVGEWADLNGIPKDDESRKWLTDYIIKQIPEESIISTVDRQSNNNFGYWNARFQAQREDKARETELTKIINNSNNIKLKERLDQISKDTSLNSTQKQIAIKNLYAEAGYNPQVGNNGEIFGRITLGSGTTDRKQNVTLNASNAEVIVYNKSTKKNEWVSVGKAMQLKSNKNYYVSPDISNFSSGQAMIVPNEIRMYQTYTGNDGRQYQLNANNLGAYASTNKKEMMTTTYGNIYLPPTTEGGSSGRSEMQVRFNSRPEPGTADRAMLDDILTSNQQFATDPGFKGNVGTNYK
jgi:hypothetical protein